MAIAMDHVSLEVDHSGYGCDWQNRPSVVDWESFQLQGHDDFQDLIESMMDDGGLVLAPGGAVEIEGSHEESHSNSNSNSNSSESTDMVVVDEENDEDYKGLKLVHLLIAAAEALDGSKSRDLAGVILVRLKEMVSSASTDGTKTNVERLAAYFTEALQGLLESAVGVHKHHHHRSDHSHSHRHSHSSHNHNHNLRQSQTDILTAFQLLQDMSPYVNCGKRVHIVDYDIMEGIQWASLMQALVSRKEGPPGPHLRITAITRGGTGSSGRRSIGTVQETGRRLIAFAASIGQPFSFHQCRLDSDETFRPSVLKLVRGESLVVNCMLNLPHFNFRAPDSVSSFLSGPKSLNLRIVTLVEEELGTGPVGKPDFLGRFMDTLHHYSAVYDSLEAGFPMQSRARALVERLFLGPRISGSLARIYCNREKPEETQTSSWGDWLATAGLKPVTISSANHCQAKLLLSLFNDGYRVEEVANNKIVLGRKLRRLLSASVWTTTSSSDSDY
ncbi:hypothetical protein ACB092_12G155000 [Castanea dentata]